MTTRYGRWLAVHVLSLAVALGSFAYTGLIYSRLGSRFPVHFNFWGQPDGWAPTTPSAVFLEPGITLALVLLFLGISYGFSRAKDPRKLLSLPVPPESIAPEKAEAIRAESIRMLTILNVFITADLTWMNLASLRVALGIAAGIGPWPGLLLLVGVFVIPLPALIRLIRLMY